MRTLFVDPAEYLYPDRTEYPSGAASAALYSARGSYACTQMLFYGLPAGAELSVSCEGWSPELYRMVPVYVERNEGLNEQNRAPHQPEREAPYYVYEALAPIRGGKLTAPEGVCALYLSEKIAPDAAPGLRNCAVIVNGERFPLTVEVSPVTVPAETLTMVHGYAKHNVSSYHGVAENSPEFEALDTAYLRMMRRMHQNMLYCPKPACIRLKNGEFDTNFDGMERFIDKAVSQGFRAFLFGLGGRVSWRASTILVDGMESMSFECYRYLAMMLPRLVAFLRERGWLSMVYIGISDEPNEYNATEYRALSGLVRKLAPELRQIDAMSFGPVHGAVDVWIPLNSEYDLHREQFEVFRRNGDEMWWYDCCVPRGNGFINRFIDYPLLSTRLHFWANYRYGLTGFLHWAANYYMKGQDPFTESCPEHHNADSTCYLPAGDTHVIYPGEGEPWMSVRLEVLRASAEEYELLRALAEKNPDEANAICESQFRSFKDVNYDVPAFRAAKNRLLRTLEKTL